MQSPSMSPLSSMCLLMPTTTEHEENRKNNCMSDVHDHCKEVIAEEHDLPLNSTTLDVMLQQETKFYSSQCLDGSVDDDHHVMDWFQTMTQFCFSVVDCCDELPLYCVDVAMNLLDRFLFGNNNETNRTISSITLSSIGMIRQEILSSSEQFQLATLTCLYIASKLHSHSKCLTLNQLQRLSKNTASAQDIQSMELQILCTLQFQINPPTIVSFAQQYLQEELSWNLDGDEQHQQQRHHALFFHLVEQQARMASCQLYSFHVPVSSIALACVKNAIAVMMDDESKMPEETMWTSLERKVRSYYLDDQRDIALVQEQVQSRLRGTAQQAMEQWRSCIVEEDDEDNAIDKTTTPWLSNNNCSSVSAVAGGGISKASSSSSPTTVVSS